jgi:hypothetical protein
MVASWRERNRLTREVAPGLRFICPKPPFVARALIAAGSDPILRRMKTSRYLLFALLITFSTSAFASDAQKVFDKLKSLAGTWEGPITTTPKVPEIDGKTMKVTLRVTSMGHALMHNMTSAGRPDDPITMIYLDAGKLQLTHYCDAGNRPRMAGKIDADEKSVQFESFEIEGGTHHGHMNQAGFTFVDEDRHIEEWTFMLPGDKVVRARIDLRRTK